MASKLPNLVIVVVQFIEGASRCGLGVSLYLRNLDSATCAPVCTDTPSLASASQHSLNTVVPYVQVKWCDRGIGEWYRTYVRSRPCDGGVCLWTSSVLANIERSSRILRLRCSDIVLGGVEIDDGSGVVPLGR
ncbi:hypothetical protein BD310DRAFT_932630 [Dichomitus squalens]|uniref:Uncharacterized protein n=1 Tax=Dichomitus squalens TaxID=114155 RepID=A0A4Q9PNI6_9APHY|nr:hypothetical protein BD310DRAFT_932630 [Dichomitus squalens]